MADPGPVGGGIAGVDNSSPVVIETSSDHGLVDGDRVRVNGASPDKPILAYVKSSGYGAKKFALFSDVRATQPAAIENGAVAAGQTVDCLAKTDRAIVVGINVYPSFTTLEGPTTDADDFARWAASEAGGCVPDDRIIKVKTPVFDHPPTIEEVRPTFTEVLRAFQTLAGEATRADLQYLGRRLYIFMSGHGIFPARSPSPNYDEASLLMADNVPGNYSMHIGGQAYAEWFRAPGVFDEVVLFMDCCRDYMDDVAPGNPALPHIQPQRDQGRRFYASAAPLGSKAREKPYPLPPPATGTVTRGVFTHVLLEALRNEALCDPQGRLTGKVLASDLQQNVPKQMDNQAPDIFSKEAENMVFAKRLNPKKPKVKIDFAAHDIGKKANLWGNDPNDPIAIHDITAAPWEVTLDLDRYVVSVDNREYGFRVTSAAETKHVQIG
jgi:hypothetical protein